MIIGKKLNGDSLPEIVHTFVCVWNHSFVFGVQFLGIDI
jgi:hypothetical protein